MTGGSMRGARWGRSVGGFAGGGCCAKSREDPAKSAAWVRVMQWRFMVWVMVLVFGVMRWAGAGRGLVQHTDKKTPWLLRTCVEARPKL